MRLIIVIAVMIISLLGIAAVTILALNQLFALEIRHSLISYMNITFLMFMIRILVSPSNEIKKMQVEK